MSPAAFLRLPVWIVFIADLAHDFMQQVQLSAGKRADMLLCHGAINSCVPECVAVCCLPASMPIMAKTDAANRKAIALLM